MAARALTTDTELWPVFTAALQEAGMPIDDLSDAGQRFFSFAEGAGFGGMAHAGSSVFLRSIVVGRDRRGQGLGGTILSALMIEARRQGAEAAWLLTTTAEGFFARHGFFTMDRDAAPPEIAVTSQFRGLCPTSAVLMCRRL